MKQERDAKSELNSAVSKLSQGVAKLRSAKKMTPRDAKYKFKKKTSLQVTQVQFQVYQVRLQVKVQV